MLEGALLYMFYSTTQVNGCVAVYVQFHNEYGAAHGVPNFAGGGSIFRDFKGAFMGGFAAFFGIQDSLFVC
ncbi:hypothetical protein Lal_00023980 [Lupinus albus]|nr:hypothetical protein Lal_00023980 [Lupinus albus]